MAITPNDYNEMTKKASPNSKSYKSIPLAFLFGGIICSIGQFLTNLYQSMGLELETASTCASVSLIFLAALLTGLNVFDNIAKIGGAGCLVPITGFSNAMTAPAMDFKSEGYVLGLGAKLFSIAGPVIVYGISSAVVYGVILFLFRLY